MCHCYAIVTGEDLFGHPEIMRSMHVHLLCVGVGQGDFEKKLVSSTEFLGDFGISAIVATKQFLRWEFGKGNIHPLGKRLLD